MRDFLDEERAVRWERALWGEPGAADPLPLTARNILTVTASGLPTVLLTLGATAIVARLKYAAWQAAVAVFTVLILRKGAERPA